jgi:DNA-binding protein
MFMRPGAKADGAVYSFILYVNEFSKKVNIITRGQPISKAVNI